ncbi:MAG: type II toxin-antitoxin system HicA family toxin [Bdellovibrionales bacterium]|nr:type II toxin-antitoxin system HicA family toxin [Bdellovibrionales bacterium]
MPISGKKIIKKLLKEGWSIKSQTGSHVKMVKGDRITMVSVHGGKDLGKGLVRVIEKQTGVKLI